MKITEMRRGQLTIIGHLSKAEIKEYRRDGWVTVKNKQIVTNRHGIVIDRRITE